MNHDDTRERVDNTLEILASLQGNEPHALRRALALSAETLKEVRAYLKEIEAELDVLTTPGRKPAEELVRLQKELAQATDRVNGLERQLASEKQARRVDEQLREADKKRLAELEQQTSQYEAMLLKDDAAFSKYLDRAMDSDEKRGRRPPQR